MSSSNMYPNVGDVEPSAPMMETKVYPPPYPPPPAYTETPNQFQPQPQQQQAQPGPVHTTTTVITDRLPSKSVKIKCYYCNEDIFTKIEGKANCFTWVFCTLICLFGCFCGCCLIPFCTNGSRDVLHYCPKCKRFLGAYERLRFR